MPKAASAIQPTAVQKDLSYRAVLTQIKQTVKLDDLGIKDVRLRVTSTGARVLELPGTNSDEKADALAQRLRGILNASDVLVARPVKCAE